jgi:putative DNA primase/helicase
MSVQNTQRQQKSQASYAADASLLSRFLDKLEGVKKQGGGFIARCPAHDDRRQSLSVREGEKGIVFHCHAGCESFAVCAALGLKLSDLFAKPASKHQFSRKIVATYDYHDKGGKLIYQVVRFEPKDFRQRRPDGAGGWIWNLEGVDRVLYRLPELLAADPRGTVFIVEGEKDVDRMRSLGLTATCNVGGAGKWRQGYAEFLRGRKVVILPDNDDPGRKHADRVARSLVGVAASLKILDLPGIPLKGDGSDWLDADGTIAALQALSDAAPEWEPTIDSQAVKEGAQPEPAGVVPHHSVLDSILERVEALKFSDLFADVESIKQKHYLVASIEELLKLVKAHNYQLARKNDFVFAYNGEYWKQIDRDDLKDFLMTVAQRQGIAPFEARHYEFRDKLYKQFIALAGLRTPEPADNKVLINLLNGTFEISAESQEIREFRSVDFLTHQLSFRYDQDATAPKFQKYLDRVLPEKELQDIVAEYFGYVFTKNLKLEKALLLYGSGANGKSVLFDVMNALLGHENTANYSLADLMEEHNRAQIAHKLLNYGSEINASVTKDIFKTLASCEPIMARLKYGNSFLMERYAKLCFNCNELPKDIEQTDAYFRRLIIVPFRVTIPESEWVTDLAQQIIREELAGVFNWVLAGLKRLLARKKFTESNIVKEMLAEYRRESDSVACFLRDENWMPDPHNPEHTEPLKKIHLAYQSYCREAGLKPLGRNQFKKRLCANKIIEAPYKGYSQEFYINRVGHNV